MHVFSRNQVCQLLGHMLPNFKIIRIEMVRGGGGGGDSHVVRRRG
jgi:hypothetical protein